MKLFHSITLILFLTVSFGDCGSKPTKDGKSTRSPKSPKSPKGDSHEQLTATTGALSLFVVSNDQDQSMTPYEFTFALQNVISKNYQMYYQIKNYVDSFTKHDADWSPIELIIIKMKVTFDISDSQELETLKKQFNTYKPKLNELMKKIEPVHKQNQKLAEIVNDFYKFGTKLANSTTKPKINPKLTEEMQKEANKVNQVFQEFEKVMKNFQMKAYIQKLKEVRAAIVKLQNGKMFLDEAQQIFEENVHGSEELVAPNVATLDAALKIHYADLTKANQQLQGIVQKAMQAHGPAKHAKK